ncbi:MAG: (2Fe-2S)-binding protein [Rhodocyclaceae bacterium]|jgi:Bacterioferritin-associated ferredoxin|nr:(2Fe-2S)-binding protein [Rhodocyclaceae bacterium]
MYVCICNAITERHIEAAVASGATRMRDLHDNLGVASECGRCASCAHQCLKSALATTNGRAWRDAALQTLSDALSGPFPNEMEARA